MRILLFTQYYPPEIGAPQNRLSDLAQRLVAAGHIVTVLTAFPNYPTGTIFKEYERRFVADERQNGIRIIRTWLYATKSKAFFRRILNYCSFAAISLVVGMFKLRRQDFVIVESPPLFSGVAGFLLSRLKFARFALNVSDLWPESAVALGVVQNPLLIRVSTYVEELLYRKADLITGQTEGIVASIRARCNGKPVVAIPNGVNCELFASGRNRVEARERIRTELNLRDYFVAGYVGLHGLAQGLETVLHAAQALSTCPEILFVFIGDGPEKHNLEQLAKESGLKNVKFFPPQPAWRIPEVLCAIDVALVPLKRIPLFRGALPSKMFEAMGAGLPVVVSVEGEAEGVVSNSRGGICIEPENSTRMAEAILDIYHDPASRASLGQNAQTYVMTHYDRKQAAAKYEELLLAAVGARKQ